MRYEISIWVTPTALAFFTVAEDDLMDWIDFCRDRDISISNIRDKND